MRLRYKTVDGAGGRETKTFLMLEEKNLLLACLQDYQ